MRSQGLSDFADNIRKEYKIPEIGYAVLTSDSILEMNILGFKRAGDLNINLPDYAKFIQQQLLGLAGRSSLLSKEEFEFLHYGVPEPDHYSIGWTWAVNIKGQHVSAFNGSAETFYCFAYIIRDIDRAYIVLANCGSEQADAGVRKLLAFLINKSSG